jgi:hypothetical protein
MFNGASLGIAMNRFHELNGLAFAAYNEVRTRQRGLTIGIYNRAEELQGVQIGLLNFAGNNGGIFRWLPLVNAHFE